MYVQRRRKTPGDPAAAFAPPFIGAVPAAESVGDEYIPLALRWPHGGGAIILFIRNGRETILELWFDGVTPSATHRLFGLTLVCLPAQKRSAVLDVPPDVPTVEGLPRCDPAAWLALTRTGSFNAEGDMRLHVNASVRMAVTAGEAVLYIDGIAGQVTTELASGRVRIGVDARGAIAYVRLTELSEREAARLEAHRTRRVVHVPPRPRS